MTKRQKRTLFRIILSAVLLIAAVLIPAEGVLRLILFLLPYLVIGYDVLLKSARNIMHGNVFDENFLMAIATIGAIALGEYAEGVFVMLFYQVGELFQSYAVGKSRKSISELMDIRPDYANIKKDGGLVKVDPEKVVPGDIIVIKAGEKVPLDGIVVTGASSLDTSALTGESLPRTIGIGDNVISGCINQKGLLEVQVTKHFGESTVSKILDLVENASAKKAKAENFITKFSRRYTPIVVISAVLLAVLGPLLIDGLWLKWLERALTFLVISCPCALVMSIPLSFFGGIGGASKMGVLVKGASYLEALAETETIVFDKTGTLTEGSFKVTSINPVGISENELLELAAFAESYSDHPISLSLKESYGKDIDNNRITDFENLPGLGIKASVDGKIISAGNSKLMQTLGIEPGNSDDTGTVVHVASENNYLGYILISDKIKEDSFEAISGLKANGIEKLVMLTGDSKSVGEAVAAKLGLTDAYTELLPGDKVDMVEKLLGEKKRNGTLSFVGDGINDAPVLSRADVGIAMGGLGADAAIEAADIVIMDDKPSKIPKIISHAKRTMSIVKQNIVFSLVVKVLVLILSALGLTNMWAAIFADVGVMVIAVLNATRALRVK